MQTVLKGNKKTSAAALRGASGDNLRQVRGTHQVVPESQDGFRGFAGGPTSEGAEAHERHRGCVLKRPPKVTVLEVNPNAAGAGRGGGGHLETYFKNLRQSG